MKKPDPARTTELDPLVLGADEASGPPVFDLVVFDGLRSTLGRLEGLGPFVLGRDPAADIVLSDPSVSRRHAQLDRVGGQLEVHDLGSQNGSTVNGRRIGTEPAPIRSGDVLGLGESIVFVRTAARRAFDRAETTSAFLDAIERELARASAWDRPVAVLAMTWESSDGPPPGLAAGGAAFGPGALLCRDAESEVLVLLPERGEHGAREAARSVLADGGGTASGRAGTAVFPADGADAATLVEAAREAAAAAAAGEIRGADETARRLRFDARDVLVADAATRRLFDLLARLAATELPVLVTGETGAGKENAALALHAGSRRSSGPFVALNCAAVPETLLESELFGWEKGAFSGAVASRKGLLEEASGGTMLLDEAGELSPAAQAKLLRALETKTVTRVGGSAPRPADFRLVAATHRDLAEDVATGRFRKDLFFRLGEASVVVPPLRERPREIVVLARHFLAQARAGSKLPAATVSGAAMRALASWSWPGNVRELKNVVELVAATATRERIEIADLPERFRPRAAAAPDPEPAAAPAFRPLADEIAELEERRIREALDATGGNQTRAAELIGMPRRTFLLRLRRYGLGARG